MHFYRLRSAARGLINHMLYESEKITGRKFSQSSWCYLRLHHVKTFNFLTINKARHFSSCEGCFFRLYRCMKFASRVFFQNEICSLAQEKLSIDVSRESSNLSWERQRWSTKVHCSVHQFNYFNAMNICKLDCNPWQIHYKPFKR